MINILVYNTRIGVKYYKKGKNMPICTKCGTEYQLNPTMNTNHYCDRCHSSTHDSYEDIISAIEDHDLRDLKPYEHH